MNELTFTVKKMPDVGVEADALTPDTLAGKTLSEVKKQPVYSGSRTLKASDVFDVKGGAGKTPGKTKIVFEGSTGKMKRVGEKMTAGEITVNGDAGYHLGEYLSGGKITVDGNAGSWIGTLMIGGEITVTGNAGSYVGSSVRGENEGATGGRITVRGNAGSEVGVGLNGAEINIEGKASDFLGSYMRSGKIRVGGLDGRAGYAMTGGEITIEDKQHEPALYFKKTGETEEYIQYVGDVSFGGKGVIKVKK